MLKPTRHQDPKHVPSPDRRRHPRKAVDSMDWETKVVLRVESSVASLNGNLLSDEKGTRDFGWEAASLQVLRRRLKSHTTD